MIYDLIADGEHYTYAINELRGMLFTAYFEECSDLIGKRYDADGMIADEDDPEYIELSAGMGEILRNISLASEFLASFYEKNPERIPVLLKPLIDNLAKDVNSTNGTKAVEGSPAPKRPKLND